MFKKTLILGMVLGLAGSSFAKGTKMETKSLWGVRAEDLKVKEIIEVVPGTQAIKEEILSPDGKKEARIEGNEIVIRELKKGTPTEVRIKQEKEIKRMFWVPNSKKIAYIAGNELWIADVRKKENKRIVARLDTYTWGGRSYIELSPNGKEVAYNNLGDDKGIKAEIANLETGEKWVLSEGKAWKFLWLPDGEKIFLKEEYTSYLINKDGSERVTFSEPYTDLSLDGKKIAYTDCQGANGIWIMDFKTKEKKCLLLWERIHPGLQMEKRLFMIPTLK